MSNEAKTTTTVPGVKLPNKRPAEFEPLGIVYARYTLDPKAPEGSQVFASPGSFVVRNMSIEAFIASRVDRLPLPTPAASRTDQPKPARPIDIHVSEQCWVVIELDDVWDWQFNPKGPAITTRDDHGTDNWGLRHVVPGASTPAGPEGPGRDGCRIIYFGVNARCSGERQRFLCDVDFSRLKRRDEQVDPDIPNDGGKFPFPAYGKPCPEDAA